MATPAFAHDGLSSAQGFASGFLHPLGGLDHLAALLLLGLLAARLGGPAGRLPAFVLPLALFAFFQIAAHLLALPFGSAARGFLLANLLLLALGAALAGLARRSPQHLLLYEGATGASLAAAAVSAWLLLWVSEL